MTPHPRVLAAAIVTFLASRLAAQPPSGAVAGVIRASGGAPVTGANVFVLETLEGALTGADGRFSIPTTHPGGLTVIVKRLGFEQFRRIVEPAERDDVVVVLRPGGVPLAPITVQAGAYTAGEERGATLSPLDVVTTPGTAADINRTIQGLPGVQTVDEGTALFVRGGDYTETKIFLNEAPLLNTVQLLSPTGTFAGTVDPFQLDGIFFSSGGFGARYGDALSGVAGLRTRGVAPHHTATAGAGLAALSADAGVPVNGRLTVRAAANRFDLHPFLDVNGSPRDYHPAPRGRDLMGSVIWEYRDGAELKLFTVDQTNHLGVGVDDPAFSGSYDLDVHTRHAVLNWREVAGPFSPSLNLSESRLGRGESFGAFRLTSDVVQRQLFSETAWQAAAGLVVRFGGEIERLLSSVDGSLPSAADPRPGARTTVVDLDRIGHRAGAFSEVDWRAGDHWRVIPGLRTDYSSLTRRRTHDPRLNIAYRLSPLTTVTAAWGVYHQVPDPLLFVGALGPGSLAPMRATQAVAGLQIGEDAVSLRVEAYLKRYRDLAQLTRDYTVVASGSGRARGIDIFFKVPLPLGFTTRETFSVLSARRSDPNTGVMARAPFDISSSQTLIVEHASPFGIRTGLAYRAATGRPITPVTSAHYDPAQNLYLPEYGAPMSERLPALRRLDLSFSRYRPLGRGWSGVLYVSLSNVLNRENVYDYRYSTDYRQRFPIRSIFNRAVYVGASLLRS